MVFLLCFVSLTLGFVTTIQRAEIQCYSEDLGSQILMVGQIRLMPQYTETSFKVTVIDPAEEVLFDKQATRQAKYSFTSYESGKFSTCIENQGEGAIEVDIDIKFGARAKDYSAMASTRDLKSSELRLKKSMDQTTQIHSYIQYLREREEAMRNTNQTIHNRVIGYSICTIVFLVVLSLVQILYLKRFFRMKKLA